MMNSLPLQLRVPLLSLDAALMCAINCYNSVVSIELHFFLKPCPNGSGMIVYAINLTKDSNQEKK